MSDETTSGAFARGISITSIFYALQSTHFTRLAPIEPALSAKSLVDNGNRIPADVRPRIHACLKALESSSGDRRLTYFRALVHSAFPNPSEREEALITEYRRAMKFVYREGVCCRPCGPGGRR